MKNRNPSPSISLHFHETGRGQIVLLVHGWMVSGRVWDRLLPRLSGFRVLAPDLPGAGLTPADDDEVSLDNRVARLAAFCERQDLHETHLVGHSMGGQLAALLAAKLPHRFATLTLLNPVPVQGLDFPAELQPLFRNCGGDRDSIGRIIDMSCLQLDPAGRELLVEDGLKTSPRAVSTGFDAFRCGDSRASLDSLQVPATVVATDDPFLPPAFLQSAVVDRLPHARLVTLHGPGHYPQIEAPRETADLLRDCFA
ncbi:MAG TPA: alpha/beta hydrolase [Gammaproteobacteria bacterium]